VAAAYQDVIDLARMAEQARRAICSAAVSYLLICHLFFFNNSCRTNYHEIQNCTDLRQTCKVGRTMSVDDQSEISFFDSATNFLDFIYTIEL